MPLDKKTPDSFGTVERLRALASTLPNAPGVYLFFGDNSTWPLYVGKSVDIRYRVLSHLRNAREARMMRQVRHIEGRRTAGEIGALLLEASLIKRTQPLYNKQLRQNRDLCSLHIEQTHIEVVRARDVDFARHPNLFGLFSSRSSALKSLRRIADDKQLCLARLNLETTRPDGPCFRAMLRQCAGVCCGRESPQQHDERLRLALKAMQIACWPYAGAIAIVERAEDQIQYHVVQNWYYLGTAVDIEGIADCVRTPAGFDADGYKILCKPILDGSKEILQIPAPYCSET